LILEAHTFLRLSSRDNLSVPGMDNTTYDQLSAFLEKMQSLLFSVQAVVSKNYFKHAQSQKQLFMLDTI